MDEERILRPAGEALLRNSAKWPRNLGIRGAWETRPQRIGSVSYTHLDVYKRQVPETETVVGVIAVGVPGEEPGRPKRKDTEEIVKFL